MMMMYKNYDVANVLYLYEKYKTVKSTALRSGYSVTTVKTILLQNEVEFNIYVPVRWNSNQGSQSKYLNLNIEEIR